MRECAVSYTHLDVYKRQEEDQEILCSRIMGTGNFGGHNNNITLNTNNTQQTKYITLTYLSLIHI